jgi:RNA 2',3'-cyclic 3'-phosphodiesterase
MERKLIRSFFAISLSPECNQEIKTIQQELEPLFPSTIRWVNTDNLHVTLKFLGEFDSKLIPNIYELLNTGLSTTGQFDLTFQNLGVFPNKFKPKVVWIGLVYPFELMNIFREIDNAAEEMGYPKEDRGFSPHVTIGRVNNKASDSLIIGTTINNLKMGEICRSHVDRVVFYKSVLTQTGPVYSELFQLPLNR